MSIEAHTEDIEARFVHFFLGALVEILGQAEANALLREATFPEVRGDFPDFDSDLQFSLKSLKRILLVMRHNYPEHSAQGIALRIGEASFSPALHAFGPALGITQSSFQLLPLRRKLPAAVEAVATMLNQVSGIEASFLQDEHYVNLAIGACNFTEEEADSLAHYFTGFLKAALYWISGGKPFYLQVAETFMIYKDGCRVRAPLKPAAY